MQFEKVTIVDVVKFLVGAVLFWIGLVFVMAL
jgi:hypothetical protein